MSNGDPFGGDLFGGNDKDLGFGIPEMTFGGSTSQFTFDYQGSNNQIGQQKSSGLTANGATTTATLSSSSSSIGTGLGDFNPTPIEANDLSFYDSSTTLNFTDFGASSFPPLGGDISHQGSTTNLAATSRHAQSRGTANQFPSQPTAPSNTAFELSGMDWGSLGGRMGSSQSDLQSGAMTSGLNGIGGAGAGASNGVAGSLGGNASPGINNKQGTRHPFDDEPPLLEELGIDVGEIYKKAKQVLFPPILTLGLCRRSSSLDKPSLATSPSPSLGNESQSNPLGQQANNQHSHEKPQQDNDADLAGPLVFCLLLGFVLLFTGKGTVALISVLSFGYLAHRFYIACTSLSLLTPFLPCDERYISHPLVHFGYIYGFGITGCLLMWLVLNLMCDSSISIDRTMHIFGYSLPPIVLLAAVSIVFNLQNFWGHTFALMIVGWCTVIATRYVEVTLMMRSQRYLIAYPIALLYACFALITVF